MKRIFIVAVLLSIGFSVNAKTYTKEQITSMVNAGNYPEQGESQSKSSYTSFADCKNTANYTLSAVSGDYPVRVLVDAPLAYLVKVWTNDGIVMVTCSEPDKKMVITQAKYK
ncbi:hypothetical protein I5F10_16065 [Proteus mirabilis]|nr:hypothetical protein [Proteus mirabilis]MBG6049682.1 hypothetical protein [Proteus mirabilis]